MSPIPPPLYFWNRNIKTEMLWWISNQWIIWNTWKKAGTTWHTKCHHNTDTEWTSNTGRLALAQKGRAVVEEKGFISIRQITPLRPPPHCQLCWHESPPGSWQIASIHHCGELQAAKQINGEMVNKISFTSVSLDAWMVTPPNADISLGM